MPRSRSSRVLPKSPELIAAGITVAVDVVYLIVIATEDEGFEARSIFVAVHLLVIAGILVLAQRQEGSFMRAALLAAAANSLILVGFLGLFSIGLPLLIAGLISMPALGRALAKVPSPAGPAIVGLATLVAAGVMIVGLLATG